MTLSTNQISSLRTSTNHRAISKFQFEIPSEYVPKVYILRLSKGANLSEIKQELINVIQDPQNICLRRKNMNKDQMILSCLRMFREKKIGKKWTSIEHMVGHFIDEMKSLYCSVHAYHDRTFDNMWSITDETHKNSVNTE